MCLAGAAPVEPGAVDFSSVFSNEWLLTCAWFYAFVEFRVADRSVTATIFVSFCIAMYVETKLWFWTGGKAALFFDSTGVNGFRDAQVTECWVDTTCFQFQPLQWCCLLRRGVLKVWNPVLCYLSIETVISKNVLHLHRHNKQTTPYYIIIIHTIYIYNCIYL